MKKIIMTISGLVAVAAMLGAVTLTILNRNINDLTKKNLEILTKSENIDDGRFKTHCNTSAHCDPIILYPDAPVINTHRVTNCTIGGDDMVCEVGACHPDHN